VRPDITARAPERKRAGPLRHLHRCTPPPGKSWAIEITPKVPAAGRARRGTRFLHPTPYFGCVTNRPRMGNAIRTKNMIPKTQLSHRFSGWFTQ
jgi:hypothetical protein